jgi:alkylated DNA repair dioxygenase AlkB
MPYKFIAAAASHSFDGAASPITDARTRLNWAAKLVLAQYYDKSIEDLHADWKAKEFNEVLALAYLDKQSIDYHDDGEKGLGPTIATLSLGAPATMKIRMKAKHYYGVSKSNILVDAPPVSGCLEYESRLREQPGLDQCHQNKKAYAQEVVKKLGLKFQGKHTKDVLTLKLEHGDIVVMHGADVQKYYEHSVESEGMLRFALTCRHIELDSLKAEDKPTYEVAPDSGFYDGSELPAPP